jgi:hypothetical protein
MHKCCGHDSSGESRRPVLSSVSSGNSRHPSDSTKAKPEEIESVKRSPPVQLERVTSVPSGATAPDPSKKAPVSILLMRVLQGIKVDFIHRSPSLRNASQRAARGAIGSSTLSPSLEPLIRNSILGQGLSYESCLFSNRIAVINCCGEKGKQLCCFSLHRRSNLRLPGKVTAVVAIALSCSLRPSRISLGRGLL